MHTASGYEEEIDHAGLEKFVLQYRPLVKKIALFIKRRLPSHIDLDDLLQSGLVGLLEAKQHYKNDQGATFETFASIRIRGSIIDSLRKNSWITRETIKNMKRISDAITKLEQRNKRHATTEEIANELGITLDEHARMSQEISLCNILSLDEIDQDKSYISDEEGDPNQLIDQEDIKKYLQVVLKELPEREQLVLSLYYVEEFTLKQISEILEVTEARVCQLHSQAIARVRSRMSARVV